MIDDRNFFRKRTLHFNGIQFEDRGIYTCEAKNLLDNAQSVVNITVQGEPDLTENCRQIFSWDEMGLPACSHITNVTYFKLTVLFSNASNEWRSRARRQ